MNALNTSSRNQFLPGLRSRVIRQHTVGTAGAEARAAASSPGARRQDFSVTALLALSLSVWILISATQVAHAREAQGGVEAFVAEVLSRNPSLQARSLTRDATRSEAAAAALWPDPEAALMLDQVPERHEGDMPMVRYQLSQMIPWPGKLRLMQSAADRRTDAARADADTARLDLIRDAKRGYWMLLLNKGLRDVNRAGRGLLDTIAGTALARYSGGSGGHHEVVRAQVEQSAIDVEALDLEGERVSTVAMLNALRDMPAAAAIQDPREPEPRELPAAPELARLEQMAQQRRPELDRMRAMQREEQAMAALARRERYPDFMTSLWYNQMLGAPDTGGVMVGVTLPLFNVRRQSRQAQSFELRAQSVAGDRRAMEAMIRFELADAARRVVTAARTLTLVRDVAAPRANQSFIASLAGYSTGGVDMVAVLEAWRSLQLTERARIEALTAWLIALADLERASGGGSSEVSP